jgi:hypothetical protein
MRTKHPFKYKNGRCEIEADAEDKTAKRLAWFNTICYWFYLIALLASAGLINALCRVLNS